jgi:heme-degrading monooxygenase HmoA
MLASIDKGIDDFDKELYDLPLNPVVEVPAMIARVARFRFPSLRHREEAERNGSQRVGRSLAAQPGFQAIYFGRIAELEAFSISIFDSREANERAAAIMNAEPLLPGQTPEMLPTPVSVDIYDVLTSTVRDRVPDAGRLGHLTLASGQEPDAADRWGVDVFGPMLREVPGVCQAYFLRSLDSEDRIALTFWENAEAMAAGGSAIGAWQGREAADGRAPAFVGGDAFLLTNLRVAIAGVPVTMPATV